MKKFTKLFFASLMALTIVTGCNNGGNNSSQPEGPVDYAATLKLDLNSGSAKQEVTVKNYVDGDTTHFHFTIPEDKVGSEEMTGITNGVLKARYLGLDTPESTGKVQPWGKAAANFTKTALTSATSIIIESEPLNNTWEKDSTGGRYLVWVWYKNDNAEDAKYHEYRCLNLEIMQEGYAYSKNDLTYRYYDVFNEAMNYANTNKLKVWGKDKDPGFYYGAAQEVTIKYLREKQELNEETGQYEAVNHLEEYKDIAIRVTAIIYRIAGSAIYLQEDDPETGNTYGMQVYLGPGGTLTDAEVGAKFCIVGTLQYYDTGCYYQISGVKNPGFFEVADDESFRVDEEIYPTNPVTITYEDFSTRYEELTFANCRMESLKVVDAYTTMNEESNSYGAMTLTCEDLNGNEVTIRTQVLKVDGELVVESAFLGKTMHVVGMIQPYKPENGDLRYQFELYSMKDVTFIG